MARAGMPSRAVSAISGVTRAAPSSIEYSVWTCRCTKESATSTPSLPGPNRRPGPYSDPPTRNRPMINSAEEKRNLPNVGIHHHRGGAQPGALGVGGEHAVFDVGAALQRRVVGHDHDRPRPRAEVRREIV